MRVLHVNFADLVGRRFSGYDLIEELRPFGIESAQAVLHKESDSSEVVSILDDETNLRLVNAIGRVERRRGMSGSLFPWARILEGLPEFGDADVVHYHIIHTEMISILDMNRLFNAKPSVWTFHDAWPITGHCVQPHGCAGWLTGCSPCPYLDRPLAIDRDCAGRSWSLKKRVYETLSADIVVASRHMLDMVRASPLTSHLENLHLIPFGVNRDIYLPDSEKSRSRHVLGIGPDDYVLFFRSTNAPHKGEGHLIEALQKRPPVRPTTLLTVEGKGQLAALKGMYKVRELGWVNDEHLLARAFSACDAFVMPSLAEGFGLMALEAMAAGRPVICFQDTAVATVTHAPECGVAVPMGDATALRAAIDDLMDNPAEGTRRGSLGRTLTETEYEHEGYLRALSSLYLRVAGCGRSPKTRTAPEEAADGA